MPHTIMNFGSDRPALGRGWTALFLLTLVLLSGTRARAQETGEINGRIIDSTTAEPLIGATVLVAGTALGAATDLDGKFAVKKVPAGAVDLRVTMVGYAVRVITGVAVKAGSPTVLNLVLSGQEVALDEVVVTAEAVLSTESALLVERKKASAIGDGISGEQIKKSADGNTAEVVKRIPSVTIVDNKFLIVRGSSERYNGAMLNNTSMSSTEPEKKSFAFDVFPSNLIENTVLTKSFTPDLPGDFSGGLLQINTVDFPSQFTLNLSAGTAYNTITRNAPFQTYHGGDNTYGPDAGIRDLPQSFPGSLQGQTLDQKQSAAKTLLNIWGPEGEKAALSQNYSVGIGDRFDFSDHSLGVVASAVHRTFSEFSEIKRNHYESTGNPRFLFEGSQSTVYTLSGGIANVGLKLFQRHKISWKNTLTRSADDEVIRMEGPDFDAGFFQDQTALRYVSRRMYATQVLGEHNLPFFSGIDVEWKLFRSHSQRSEPDYRRIYYARDLGSPGDPMFAVLGPQANLKNGGRYYSDLDDVVRGGGFDLSMPILGVKLKTGGLYEEKDRGFSSRLIGMVTNAAGNGFTDFSYLYMPIDSIFAPENFTRNGFSIDEYINGTNTYKAAQMVRAGYAMGDYLITPIDLRVIAGARVEGSTQTINTRDLTGTLPIDVENDYTDVLPSVNLVYTPVSEMNVRVAYSRTINRPELRELAPFSYYDFATQYTLTGNPNLQRTLVRNYDARWEYFPGLGEVLSMSLFYKSLTDAIEQAVVPSAALGSERTFLNAPEAENYGAEFEARKSLSFLGEYMSNVVVSLNYSWIRSEVRFEEGLVGVETKTRPLQGQSDYVINAGLSFTEPGFGTTLSVLYNRFGDRISEVSTTLEPDIVEQGRNILDLVISQTFGEMIDIKFAVKDLLHEPEKFMQGERLARQNSKGSGVSLGMSVRL